MMYETALSQSPIEVPLYYQTFHITPFGHFSNLDNVQFVVLSWLPTPPFRRVAHKVTVLSAWTNEVGTSSSPLQDPREWRSWFPSLMSVMPTVMKPADLIQPRSIIVRCSSIYCLV